MCCKGNYYFKKKNIFLIIVSFINITYLCNQKSNKSMLQTKDLTFQYNKDKIFNFSDISCNAREIVLITGNSGVGKTTLLHLISGLQKPKNGSIMIDSIDVAKLNATKLDQFRGKNIGLILQSNYFVNSLNVLENLELSSWLASSKKQTNYAKEILSELGLSSYFFKKTYELSVGQQQRVSIARAIINKPKIILADEPTSSLDDQNTEIVFNLLTQLAQNQKAALVIVTHDSRLKSKISNQIQL